MDVRHHPWATTFRSVKTPEELTFLHLSSVPMPSKVLVLFYSTYGHCFQMAKAAAEGVESAGNHAVVKRVAETLPTEVLEKMHAVQAQHAFSHVPIATVAELAEYDGLILVTPTRFGLMPEQMKAFIDATGQHWQSGALVGKAAAVMTATATQHGGNEMTILSSYLPLLHHGFILVGMPPVSTGLTEVQGLTPYGASTITGTMGDRMPSSVELEGVKAHAKRLGEVAAKLAAK